MSMPMPTLFMKIKRWRAFGAYCVGEKGEGRGASEIPYDIYTHTNILKHVIICVNALCSRSRQERNKLINGRQCGQFFVRLKVLTHIFFV